MTAAALLLLYLLIQQLQLAQRQLELGHCWQHHIPSPIVDVGYEALYAVYCVQ
jgi:hypothetical protein